MFAGTIFKGKPIDGKGVVLNTLIVPVISFSAALRENGFTSAKVRKADNLSFINKIQPDLKIV